MYIKSFTISNFRKFGVENNKIEFNNGFSKTLNNDNEFKVANKSTLIVGKNNSGKTSIIKVLKMLKDGTSFGAFDFNINLLNKIFNDLFIDKNINKSNDDELKKILDKLTIEFNFELMLEADEYRTDIITNIIPILKLNTDLENPIDIVGKVEVKEFQTFIKNVKELMGKYKNKYLNNESEKSFVFNKFIEVINKNEFVVNYYNNNEVVKKFKIQDLIEMKSIEANNLSDERQLSKAFNKILNNKYNYKKKNETEDLKAISNNLENEVDGINEKVDKAIITEFVASYKPIVEKVFANDKINVNLVSDISTDKILNNVLKYSYIENSNIIPENQFGLGYTNIVSIIAEIIDYINEYNKDGFNSKVNIISIEEPETYMHPQLQERFIQTIDETIKEILGVDKFIHTQIIITTHSSHILNSKIHASKTFDNICYFTPEINNIHTTKIVNLNDEKLVELTVTEKNKEKTNENKGKAEKEKIEELNNLKFIKQHISIASSNLFFSDAVIFVEGDTELELVPVFLDRNEFFKNKLVNVYKVNGKHMQMYHKLIKVLSVPTLILSDLDIIRKEKDSQGQINAMGEFDQIESLKDLESSNYIFEKYNKNGKKIENIELTVDVPKNVILKTQTECNKYFPTSLEEAIILENYNNDALVDCLYSVLPDITKDIVGVKKTNWDNLKADKDEVNKNIIKEKIKDNSYKFQSKLSSKKTQLTNLLIYSILTDDNSNIRLPKYITDGLNELEKLFN